MKVGGKERKLVFNINALIELDEEHGVNVFDIKTFQSPHPKYMRAIAFVGMKHGAIAGGESFDLTIEKVGEELTTENFNEVFSQIQKQNTNDLPRGDGAAGES